MKLVLTLAMTFLTPVLAQADVIKYLGPSWGEERGVDFYGGSLPGYDCITNPLRVFVTNGVWSDNNLSTGVTTFYDPRYWASDWCTYDPTIPRWQEWHFEAWGYTPPSGTFTQQSIQFIEFDLHYDWIWANWNPSACPPTQSPEWPLTTIYVDWLSGDGGAYQHRSWQLLSPDPNKLGDSEQIVDIGINGFGLPIQWTDLSSIRLGIVSVPLQTPDCVGTNSLFLSECPLNVVTNGPGTWQKLVPVGAPRVGRSVTSAPTTWGALKAIYR